MDPDRAHHGRSHLARGTALTFAAEALIFPTGLVTAAFLTRWLGPSDYGLFTLAATIVTWVEWTVASLFSRATIRFASEAEDWRPVGTTVVRLHLLAGAAAGLALAACARPIAALLGEPFLARHLAFFALDVPLFCLCQAHMSLLMGVGDFGARAIASASRWLGRLLLMLLFVGLGYSVEGAIAASIGASLCELALARRGIQPRVWARSAFSARRLWGYALPLFLFALAIRIFDKLDLIALKSLGGSAAQAGHYGAAQNLSLIPLLFSSILAQTLLRALMRVLLEEGAAAADRLARDGLRVVFWLIAPAAMIAGCSEEIVSFIFGAAFGPTAPVLALLIFAGVALGTIHIGMTIVAVVARPALSVAIAAPLVPLALIGHLLVIPEAGPRGAAAVTLTFAVAGAASLLALVWWARGIRPPVATLARSAVAGAIAYALSAAWPTPGLLLVVKLAAVSGVIAAVLWGLGELDAAELEALRARLRRRR